MDPGYYSAQAVKDLLALKQGEIDYLIKELNKVSLQLDKAKKLGFKVD